MELSALLDAVMTKENAMNEKHPIELVSDDVIDYWIANEIGGSGLSLSIQKMLRNMAVEIRENRGPAIKPDSLHIVPAEVYSSHRTGSLDGITAKEISAILGFTPNRADDPSKVVNSWSGRADGNEIAIWDYKGSQRYNRFSTYGNAKVLKAIFGDKYTSEH